MKRLFISRDSMKKQLQVATDQLNESQQKYQLLIDNMSDMVWVMDSNGVITFINDEVEKILGYKKEDVMMQPINRFLCPLHRYENCSDIIEIMKNTDFHRQELWMLHADQSTRRVVETNTKRLYSNGLFVGIQGVGRDVTDRIRMERRLNKKNKQLTMLNEISSAIASNKISLNISTLFDNITKKIVDTIHIPFCSIRLIDESGRLHCMSAAGRFKDTIDLSPIQISPVDFRNYVLQSNLRQFTDICKQYIIEHDMDFNNRAHLDNMLFVPLVTNNRPLGLIALCYTDELDEDYIDMLGSISNNIAFALEKQDLYTEIKQHYLKTISALIAAIEAKDLYTQGHSIRVAQYAISIAKELGMTQEEIEEIEIAGILHDIGKIGISDFILTKPGILEDHEYQAVKEHPSIGCRILQHVGLSENIINAALLHHKRYDLKGYPENVNPLSLPIQANIICVADAYDAMTSNRSYKLPMNKNEAMEELKRNSGTQFCPNIVNVMFQLHHKNLI